MDGSGILLGVRENSTYEDKEIEFQVRSCHFSVTRFYKVRIRTEKL